MKPLTLDDLPSPPQNKVGWPWTEQSEILSDRMPDGSEWPRISIVTPNYNYGQFIEETIRSILLQGYPNLEYILIDGESIDNSLGIVHKYDLWLTDWVSEKDGGQSDAINKGFNKATGSILGWVNSDDLLCINALQHVVDYWISHPTCNFLTGNGCFFNSDGKHFNVVHSVLGGSFTQQDLLEFHRNKYLPQPSVFFSYQAWSSLGGVNLALSYSMDLDLWLRMIQLHNLHHIDQCLSYLRLHEDSKTCGRNVFVIQEVRQTLLKHKFNDSSLSFQVKLSYLLEVNKFYAQALIRKALLECNNANYFSAWIAFLKAKVFWLPVLFSRDGIKLLFTLILPQWIYQFLKRRLTTHVL